MAFNFSRNAKSASETGSGFEALYALIKVFYSNISKSPRIERAWRVPRSLVIALTFWESNPRQPCRVYQHCLTQDLFYFKSRRDLYELNVPEPRPIMAIPLPFPPSWAHQHIQIFEYATPYLTLRPGIFADPCAPGCVLAAPARHLDYITD